MNLRKIPTEDLIAELERRRREVVKPFPQPKEPLVFRCRNCGNEEFVGNKPNFFANHGKIWHRPCVTGVGDPKTNTGRMDVSRGTWSNGQ